jgi:hypothetical protein
VNHTTFHSADELWKYSMQVVSLLREGGMGEAADLLESGVRYSTSSGWEWLGELGLAVERVSERYRPSPAVREALQVIRRTARSETPYEE